jgi:hypothetical protein
MQSGSMRLRGESHVSNYVRKSKKLFQLSFTYGIFFLLFFELIVPPQLLFADDNDGGDGDSSHRQVDPGYLPDGEVGATEAAIDKTEAGKVLKAMGETLSAVGSETSRLALEAVERNQGFLLNQSIIDTKTGEEEDLSFVDLSRRTNKVDPGLPARALIVEKIENGVKLSLPGEKYAHLIRFSKQTEDGQWMDKDLQLLDWDWDNETVELLLSDRTRHRIVIESLPEFMLNSAIPVFFLGNALGVDGLPVDRIRFLARRVDPVDKSREHQEGRLDLNERTRHILAIISDRNTVKRLEENKELVRPVNIHPALEKNLLANSGDGKIWHDAADLAQINVGQNGEQLMVGKESHIINDAIVGLQMGPLMGQWSLASPESAGMSQELASLRGSGSEAVAAIVQDPERMKKFYTSGAQEVLSNLPAKGLNAIAAYVTRTVGRVSQALGRGTPEAVRDRFTQEAQVTDFQYHLETLEIARATAARNEARPAWDFRRTKSWRRFWDLGVKERFNLAKRMRQLTTVLKWPVRGAAATATAAAADYMLAHGEHVGQAIDHVAKISHWVQSYVVPVMHKFSYWGEALTYSDTARIAILMSVFAAAWLAKPFAQHGVNKIITITGIKYLFSISITPIPRILATAAGGAELHREMKNGYFSPELIIDRIGSGREAAVNEETERIRKQNKLRSLAKALAIHEVASRADVDPLELLQQADLSKSRSEAETLVISLVELMVDGSSREIGDALTQHPDLFLEALGKARKVTEAAANEGKTLKSGIYPFIRNIVVRKVLQAMGNFGEDDYERLRNPQPPQEFADYVARSYIMDGIFTIMTSTFFGKFANRAVPKMLAYQPNIFLIHTHPFLAVSDLEQMFLHLGASAANDFLSAGTEHRAAFSAYRPAAAMDFDRVQGTPSALHEGVGLARLLLDVRNNNYFVGFGIRSWTQCVNLLQGFFVIGMALRLSEQIIAGKPAWDVLLAWKTYVHATVGQTYFIYIAPFVYRWIWAVVLTTTRSRGREIAAICDGFEDQLLQLQQTLARGDFEGGLNAANFMVARYQEKHLSVPDVVLESIKPAEGELPLAWANRVLTAVRTNPPVPERMNEKTAKGLIFVSSVTTTVLASYLMADSFDERPFWGYDNPEGSWGLDTKDWNLWDGVSPHDSVPALMTKSLLNVWAVWAGGHLFNFAYDSVQLGRADTGGDSPKFTPAQRNEIADKVQASWKALGTVPGMSVFPSLRTPNPRLSDPPLQVDCSNIVANQVKRAGGQNQNNAGSPQVSAGVGG